MAIEAKHGTDPTPRKKQVRAEAWAFIVFTAGTALSACGTTKPAAEGPPPAASLSGSLPRPREWKNGKLGGSRISNQDL